LFVKFPPCGDAHHPKKKKFSKRNKR
jgi:hypothetical protein